MNDQSLTLVQDEKSAMPTPVELINKLVNLHFHVMSLWLAAIDEAHRWKRTEYAHISIRKFMDDPVIKNAMLIMDWQERIVVLPEEQATFLGEKKFTYREDALPDALSVKSSFSLEETLIRDTFDAFFTGIEQFHDLVEAGVMRHADFKPYLAYWAQLLSGKVAHKNSATLAAIDGYVAEYFDKGKVRAFLDAVQ
jgi:hypothetical protein